MTIDCDWDGDVAKSRVRHNIEIFNKAFSGDNPNYEYIDTAKIKTGIQHCFRKKAIEELLEEEELIIRNDKKLFPINNNVAYALKRTRDKVNSVLSLLNIPNLYQQKISHVSHILPDQETIRKKPLKAGLQTNRKDCLLWLQVREKPSPH